MEGKGTPKNEQNQFCHSPAVKAMTPSEVERQDSHAAGVKCTSRSRVLRSQREKVRFSGPETIPSTVRHFTRLYISVTL